jgi:hypothetical protein
MPRPEPVTRAILPEKGRAGRGIMAESVYHKPNSFPGDEKTILWEEGISLAGM